MELDGGAAAVVAIYAALTYDIFSAVNSSPQTTELNAAARTPTLMKWVRLAALQAGGFIVLGAVLDPRRWPPVLGGGLGMAAMVGQYVHAQRSGTTNPGTPTERY